MSDDEDSADQLKARASGVREIREREWSADSAAQALAWLRLYVYGPGTVVGHREREDGVEALIPRKPLFRGQTSDWPMIPSLLRIPEGPERERASRATRAAAKLIELNFRMILEADGFDQWPPVWEGCGEAAAQHYRMATALLDWSPNPMVAIDFATRGPSGGTSYVYWLSITDADELGLQLTIPPIFVTRLYLQRGCFTRMEPDSHHHIAERIQKLSFPRTEHVPARPYGGPEWPDLLQEDAWFGGLRDWCSSSGHQYCEEDPVQLSFRHADFHPAAQHAGGASPLFFAGNALQSTLAFLEQLAGRDSSRGAVYDPFAITVLRRDNPALFRWLDQAGIHFRLATD